VVVWRWVAYVLLFFYVHYDELMQPRVAGCGVAVGRHAQCMLLQVQLGALLQWERQPAFAGCSCPQAGCQ
jgi:hypothetical protein